MTLFRTFPGGYGLPGRHRLAFEVAQQLPPTPYFFAAVFVVAPLLTACPGG